MKGLPVTDLLLQPLPFRTCSTSAEKLTLHWNLIATTAELFINSLWDSFWQSHECQYVIISYCWNTKLLFCAVVLHDCSCILY